MDVGDIACGGSTVLEMERAFNNGAMNVFTLDETANKLATGDDLETTNRLSKGDNMETMKKHAKGDNLEYVDHTTNGLTVAENWSKEGLNG